MNMNECFDGKKSSEFCNTLSLILRNLSISRYKQIKFGTYKEKSIYPSLYGLFWLPILYGGGGAKN